MLKKSNIERLSSHMYNGRVDVFILFTDGRKMNLYNVPESVAIFFAQYAQYLANRLHYDTNLYYDGYNVVNPVFSDVWRYRLQSVNYQDRIF